FSLHDGVKGEPGKRYSVKYTAELNLKTLGREPQTIAAAIVKIEELTDDKLRGLSVEQRAAFGLKGRELVPLLLDVLRTPLDPAVRTRCGRARGCRGSAAGPPAPDPADGLLEKDLDSRGQTSRLRAAAAWALGQIGAAPPAGIAALQDLAAGKDEEVSAQA